MVIDQQRRNEKTVGQETQTEQKKRIHPPRREKTGAEAPPLWLDLLHALVWSVVLVALCFTLFVRIICVEGISMEPALRQNDRVLVLSTSGTLRRMEI